MIAIKRLDTVIASLWQIGDFFDIHATAVTRDRVRHRFCTLQPCGFFGDFGGVSGDSMLRCRYRFGHRAFQLLQRRGDRGTRTGHAERFANRRCQRRSFDRCMQTDRIQSRRCRQCAGVHVRQRGHRRPQRLLLRPRPKCVCVTHHM